MGIGGIDMAPLESSVVVYETQCEDVSTFSSSEGQVMGYCDDGIPTFMVVINSVKIMVVSGWSFQSGQ